MLFNNSASGQTIPVGTPVFNDYYRRMQLLSNVDSNLSFSIRPIFPELKFKHNIYDPDSTLSKDSWVDAGPVSFAKGSGSFQLLPFSIQQQYNSHHPYGWNDEVMIPAKGYQTLVSGGFYVRLGLLSIQLRPQYVYAANPDFEGSSYNFPGIDLPTRFGNSQYQKLSWGQSSIRLTLGPISAGLSNENLWWGPGIKNSLILSNNAPGFKHLTLNTVRPIKTFLGHFEGQIISGRLDPSGLQTETNAFVPDPSQWRYFTGFNINYHPKWVPGLTLGIIRTFNSYNQYVEKLSHYLPWFYPYQKASVNNADDPIPRDQLTSLYARWLFTDAKAELYFEYGVNDNSYDLRQFINRPDLARAYQFGLRKMVSLNDPSKYILIETEITQMSQSIDRMVDGHGNWYRHHQVLAGHTNRGEILGAGIGPGGNSQSIDVSWIYGLKRIGVSFDRYEHDAEISNITAVDINGNSRRWVDFAFGLQGEWNYKNLIFNAKLQHIRSLNYQWVLKDYNPSKYYIPNNDVSNLHGELGVTFRF
ncbi:capsule assembly Wzi family protein [Mucilaginibacter antarcticus]|uniref:capsule assembly Wzi family protein n=1 Tax=Mucilaginibacter antarcticus TaxID=1855725 RepID=UPI00363915A2